MMASGTQLQRYLILLEKLIKRRDGDPETIEDERRGNLRFDLSQMHGEEHRDIISLYNNGLITGKDWSQNPSNQWSAGGIYAYEITGDGIEFFNEHGYLAKGQTVTEPTKGSKKAFVAMWFDPSMSEAYESGIEPALLAAGYEPVRIDQDLTVDDIMERVREQIVQCDFLIADLTHGTSGPRGGVYWEAGYADALKKPVIFTCREGQTSDIHFDVDHRYHIRWKTPKDLRDALRQRIPARLAAG